MHAENLLVDAGAEGEQIENVGAVSPDYDIAVLLDTLLIKAVDLRNRSRLVVTTDQSDTGRVPALERHE